MVDPDLRALRSEAYALRAGCERLIREMQPPGVTTPDQLAVETDRLFALLDGLAVHAATRPDQADPMRIVQVLDHHLNHVASLTSDG